MRILYLVLPGHTSKPDVAALFGRYLPRLGVNSDLVTQATADVASVTREAEWGGGQWLRCQRTGRRGRDQLLAFAHDIKTLWRTRSDVYDAVQVRDKVFAAVFAIWVVQCRRLPMFYWMSFPMSDVYIRVAREGGLSIGLRRWLFLMFKGHVGRVLLYRYVLPRCTHVFVQSDRMLDDLSARGISRDRMTPVPMGVDLERTFPTRADAFHDQRLLGRRVVAYLGSFEQFRRLDFLLEVVQRLTPRIPDVMLLMIGDGTQPLDRQQLERRADSLGIGARVLWTGWVGSDDAWRWLVNADVAVSIVPRGELYDVASPTKLVEYLALGIPAVANDQPDQERVLTESAAGLCCGMDHAAMTSAIERILSDPALAERMHTAGPRYVAAERGYDRIAVRVADVYRRRVGMTGMAHR